MTGTALGVVGVVVTALAGVFGTVWAKRKTGPEMTQVVFGSVSEHVIRLDTTIGRLETDLENLRAEYDALREEFTARVAQLERELAVERVYTSVLVTTMRSSGMVVPPRPEADMP